MGYAVRERAKQVVNLLTNEELLEEERVKAKNIRDKMSNVLGSGSSSNYDSGYGGSSNSGYGGYGGSSGGYSGGGNNKYDNYGSKNNKKDSAYNYGNSGLGVYGDYTYNKSTLDKYKDKNEEKPTNGGSGYSKPEEKKPDIVVEQRKPTP